VLVLWSQGDLEQFESGGQAHAAVQAAAVILRMKAAPGQNAANQVK
jgi:hypothetical protein